MFAGSVDGDRTALIALYNATHGSSWFQATGWENSVDIGSWSNVDVDEESRVRELILHSNNLEGECLHEACYACGVLPVSQYIIYIDSTE